MTEEEVNGTFWKCNFTVSVKLKIGCVSQHLFYGNILTYEPKQVV